MNQPYTPLPPSGPRTSTMAIISLVGGITGWTILPFLGSIAAIIFGHIAKSEIKKGGGMIMGYLSIALGICLACIWVLVLAGLITLPFAFPTVGNTTY